MSRDLRTTRKAPPVSVALAKPERAAFASEAKRRQLGLSTTIRALAFERITELADQRQRERATRWQTDRLKALIERIGDEGFQGSTQADIEAIFVDAEALDRSGSPGNR